MNWSDRRDQLQHYKTNLERDERDLRSLAIRCNAAMERNSRMYPSLKKKLDEQKALVEERKETYANMLKAFEKDFPKIKRSRRK